MRSSNWIAALGFGAMVFVSLGVSAEERPSVRDSADCHAVARLFAAGNPSDLFVFRDAFRPNSEEAAKREYEPIAWSAQERELVLGRLRALLGEQSRGLLQRAAADGALSLYRAKLTGFAQAKGGYRRLTFDGTAFPRPGYDWLTRIIAHELVHSADPYNKLSVDPAWNVLIEPRIAAVRALLAKEGLTIVMAASLPLSDRRTRLDKKIQQATGLPSAYSGYSTEEAIAEVVSFTLDKDQRYEPPSQMAAFLRKRLLCPASNANDPSDSAYREGLRQAAAGSHAAAVVAFSEAVRLDPQFMFAYMERANSRQKLNANVEAVQDFSKAIMLSPLYSYIRPYLLTSRGLLQLQTGDVSSAAVDCAAALPLKADYYNSLLLCGRVKLAKSDFAGAIADLEAAIKVLPNYKAQVDPWLEKARAGQMNKVK
jgi:tetratricopeptide (TPR) repeat protein